MAEAADAPVVCAAPAKLNLYLHVTGRRDDGFHLLDSLIAFAAVHDAVRLERADALTLSVDGPLAAGVPTDGSNLVLKAAEALRAAFGLKDGAAITLTKRLPAAAGIGGGSSDAAAALRGLCRLWRLPAGDPRLGEIALALGADVPMCLAGHAAVATGIGERLTPFDGLPAAPVVLVNPGVPVATPAVFKARTGPFTAAAALSGPVADAPSLAAALARRGNDLGPAAETLAPVIADARLALESAPGNLLARMSGSGATCFGLFQREKDARDAAARIASERPDWWISATRLVGDVMEIRPDPG
jgi:4-diphosphocytidyl-2-C-methyl-D-erythritol kinase